MRLAIKLLSIALLLSLLQACGTQPSKPADGDTDAAAAASETADKLLLQASETEDINEASGLRLRAAELFIQAQENAQARSILSQFSEDLLALLPKESQAHHLYLTALLEQIDGNYPAALALLGEQQLMESLPYFAGDLPFKIRELRAQLMFDLALYQDCIRERLEIHTLLTDENDLALNDALIWQALMELPLEELAPLAQSTRAHMLKGWYELAAISKNNQTNLVEQYQQVEKWMIQWPEHPASFTLPVDLQLLRELVDNLPSKVAVLLPFSGKLESIGNAIRDGMMSSYYQCSNSTYPCPTLSFYDTQNVDINFAYDQAVLDGAELIIGPLSKEKISELSLRPELPVPTLALNVIENPLGAVPNLYQFGLGVEDEARLAAQKAWRDGHRRMLALAPNSTWGDRSIFAFQLEWQKLGGEFIRDYRFSSGEYSKTVKSAFKVDESEERAREIRRMVGSIETQARPRQDVDAIFLAAEITQARQINPALAFHYVGDIPVYATSQVFNGSTDATLDQDLNGIKFSTLPWYFNQSLPERKNITQFGETNPGLQPLYALGVDSFYLFPRLRQLEQVANASFYGQTGKLKLDKLGKIVRDQVWAEYRSGKVIPIRDSKIQ